MLLSLEAGVNRTLERRGVHLDWVHKVDVRPDFLAEAVAKWWINEGTLDELPKVAATAPAHERASGIRESIAEANGADADLMAQLVAVFMRDHGYANDYNGGVALFCDLYLGRIARGEVHPYLGAACLEWAGVHAEAAPHNAIRTFRELAQKWDSDSSSRSRIEEEILAEAKRRTEMQ